MGHRLLVDDPFATEIFSGQLPSPPWMNLDLDDILGDDDIIVCELAGTAANATSSGSGSGSGGPGSHKKLSHNAYERDRRKQLNELYFSLRSLLPGTDHTKKLSIPTTVCQVLEYIPELQKQVENLEKKKQELTSAHANRRPGVLSMGDKIAPTVSATCLNDKEIMVQVSLLNNMAAGTTLRLSKCIEVLENEGLHLISSSALSTFGNKTFYNLHLQRNQGVLSKECPAFCDKLEEDVKKMAGLYLQR